MGKEGENESGAKWKDKARPKGKSQGKGEGQEKSNGPQKGKNQENGKGKKGNKTDTATIPPRLSEAIAILFSPDAVVTDMNRQGLRKGLASPPRSGRARALLCGDEPEHLF